MPTRTDQPPPVQQDRDRQPSSLDEETRNFETEVSNGDRNYNAPFDEDLNPIEDEDVNTHGSER